MTRARDKANSTVTNFASTGIDDNADANAITIDSSENVGIGTASPSSYNSGADDLVLATTGSTGMTIASGTSNNGSLFFADGTSGADQYRGYVQYEQTNNAMAFGTNAAERMRIDNIGNLLVGITNYSNVGSARGVILRSDAGAQSYIQVSNTGTSETGVAYFYNGNGVVGTIKTENSGTSYNTSSDYRLKENISYTWDATTRLKQLKPARFNFIADADTTVDGFLAHEAQAVVPEAVTGTHNEVDDDGNPVMQGIDQSKLVPLLTKALIESVAKIEELEARITALETG